MRFFTRSGILKFLVSVFFIFLLTPAAFYYLPEVGLDISWNIALHLAYKYQLQFGRDFVFTYGPLGILNSRLPISISIWVYIMFDLYFIVITVIVLREVFRKNFTVLVAVFIFLNVLMTEYRPMYEWYFYYFFFFLLRLLNNPARKAWLIHALFLSVLSFYFKVSFGVITVILLSVVLFYLLLSGKKSLRWFVAVIFSYSLGIWIGSVLLNVNLPGYLKGSLSLIDAYNDAMFYYLDNNTRQFFHKAIMAFGLFVATMTFLAIKLLRQDGLKKNLDGMLAWLLVTIGLYIIFKSSFVRLYDGGLFFQFISLFAALVFLNTAHVLVRRVSAVCCWALLILATWMTNHIPGIAHPFTRLADLTFLRTEADDVKKYFTEMGDFNSQAAAYDRKVSARNEYKDLVGGRTADIIPTEISTIYFNGLHYAPAPVIQQYAAYDSYLDGLNYAKYSSVTAPDFILYSVGSLDDRYAFFDGAKAKLALFNHYRITGSIHDDLVLRRYPDLSGLETTASRDTSHYKLGDNIPLAQSDDLLYSRIFVRYNLLGSLKRLLFQPPVLKISFILNNNTEHSFRAIVPMLADGMILNKFIITQNEFQEYMQSAGVIGTDVAAIRLQTEEAGFKPDITMVNSYYRFSPKSPADRAADSLAILVLRSRLAPRVVSLSGYEHDTIQSSVEEANDYASSFSFTGWAFRDSADNRRCQVTGILTNGGDTGFALATRPFQRSDIEYKYQRSDVGLAGFRAEVAREKLPPGRYRLALACVDTVTGRKWITYTSTTVMNPYLPEKVDLTGCLKLGKNDFDMNAEKLTQDYHGIFMDGWVQLKNTDTTGLRTRIILQGRNGTFGVEPEVKERPDVADYFHDPRYRRSGFTARIPTDRLDAGVYSISFEKRAANGTRYLMETGKQVTIRASADSSVPRTWVPVP